MKNSGEPDQTPSAQQKSEQYTKWERFFNWLMNRTWSTQCRQVIKRWGQFAAVILDPWTLLLLAAIWWLFVLATAPKIDQFASTLLFTMQTVLSAVAGGRVAKSWADLADPGVLGAKGLVAVRSLKLVLRQASSLESRVESFKAEILTVAPSQELVHRSYDEIIDNCRALQDQTTSSIENWIDIVPEARVLIEQDAAQSLLKTTIDQLNGRIAKLTQDVQDGITQTDEARAEQESLRSKLADAQANLARSRIKLSPGGDGEQTGWSLLVKMFMQAARSAAVAHEAGNSGVHKVVLPNDRLSVDLRRSAAGESSPTRELPQDDSSLRRGAGPTVASESELPKAAESKVIDNDVTK